MSDTSANIEHREISSPRVGRFKVHIQGDLRHKQFVVLTVHDLGCNHTMWLNFLSHWSMAEIVKRAAFIHVDVPGQEDGEADLPSDYVFPSMQTLGEDLICVLDQLDVKQVVCLGEGAGANILARFAMAQPDRVMGACLIHCTGSAAGVMESLKDKIIEWKLNQIGMNPTAESYLVLHRFGSFEKAQNKEQLAEVIDTFQKNLRSKINPHNLKRFVHSFLKRSNINNNLNKFRCPVLMVTGAKASFNHTVHTLYGHMTNALGMFEKGKGASVELLEVESVANVIEEKPEKLAESFLYFCQGCGVGGGVPMPRMQRTCSQDGEIKLRQRSMSMEEADLPKGIYSTSPTRFGSPSKGSNIAMSTSPGKTSPVPMSTSPPKN